MLSNLIILLLPFFNQYFDFNTQNNLNPKPRLKDEYIPGQAMSLKNGEGVGYVKAVSEMLGHADVGITLKIYHHVNARSIRDMHVEHSPLRKLEAVSALA